MSNVAELEQKIKEIEAENAQLKGQLAKNPRPRRLSSAVDDRGTSVFGAVHVEGKEDAAVAAGEYPEQKEIAGAALTVVVIGASGDLAWKKTYPALFSLYCHGLLPAHTIFAGYARTAKADADFKKQISKAFAKKFADKTDTFLNQCFYFAGQYGSAEDFGKFDAEMQKREAAVSPVANRIFYLAIPPTLFVEVGRGIQPAAQTKTGWNRVIVEKPFGRDSGSSAILGKQLSALFREQQLFRIDHYLGKEMVQNLMTLRFANRFWEPVWNNQHIACVLITFKEDFGTQGRGGYFDEFGIIRDVIQNHLLQILSLVAMEAPVSMSAEDVRDEKVKLLRAIPPVLLEETVLGQYDAHPQGKEPAYLDDPTVPKGSVTPTFASLVLHINNARWAGVPFILKAGKALNERKAEIRIHFRKPANNLFPNNDLSANELVIRVQPNEAVYLKTTAKKPGLTGGFVHTQLDLSYDAEFGDAAKSLPDAYERLILDVARGDHNLFVRSDELRAAWQIFTPLLHRIENEKLAPEKYAFGSRGPPGADAMVERLGFQRTEGYVWRAQAQPVQPKL